jgi:L-lactate dehydrogenase complex protein LldG
MDSKEKIMQSLRMQKIKQKSQALPEINDKDIYRDMQTNPDEMLSLFKQKLENLHGEVHIAEDFSHAAHILLEILESIKNKRCIAQLAPLILKIININPALKSFIDIDASLSIPSNKFALYNAGISMADFLVARTGSIILRSITAGGRRLSILPPTHIIIARTNQLVSSLDEVISYYNQDDVTWSFATIITGPSRTADIEKELVLGAHGPKRLITIILP